MFSINDLTQVKQVQGLIMLGTKQPRIYISILIIPTIAIINCADIQSSTIRNSITREGFIARSGWAPTTVPYDLQFLERSNDACNIDQTLVISDNLVKLKAFTGTRECSVQLTTNDLKRGLSVKILHSGVKTGYSYFYIEVLGNESDICAGQYMLVSDDIVPCMTIIKGSHFSISFQNTEIIVELHAVDVVMVDCFKGFSDSLASCNVSTYKSQVWQELEHITLHGPSWISFSFDVTRYFIDCKCKQSALPCVCILDYREWHYACDNESARETRSDWIYYNPHFHGLSFADTGLCEVTAEAFDGLYSLKFLSLHHNNIRALPVPIFKHIPQLTCLDLSYNYISNLTSAIFDSLHDLHYLDLSYNEISRPKVSLIEMFINQNQIESYLFNLSHNDLRLPEGAFTAVKIIRGTHDLSNSHLILLPMGAFSLVQTIQGTLNLSQNDFMSLPDGMFSTVENVWSQNGERAVIDLSHNSLTILPDGIFISLWLLDGGTIDLTYNNLVTLPNEMFSSLLVVNDGHLVLSHNHLSALPMGSFTSLMVVKEATIDLSHNDMILLSDGVFNSLQKMLLGTLNFSYNSLTQLPHDIFSSLYILDGIIDLTGNNEVVTLPDGIFSTLENMRTTFNLSHRNLSILPEGMFVSLQIIEGVVDLSHNLLTSLPEGTFVSITGLNGTLNLSYNSLVTLPYGVFSSIVVLRGTIDISRNNLLNLPDGMFMSVENVTYGTIDLSYNDLVTLPPEIFNVLENLHGNFDLSHNVLSTLPYNVLTSLRTINGRFDLSHNTLFLLPNYNVFISRSNVGNCGPKS